MCNQGNESLICILTSFYWLLCRELIPRDEEATLRSLLVGYAKNPAERWCRPGKHRVANKQNLCQYKSLQPVHGTPFNQALNKY